MSGITKEIPGRNDLLSKNVNNLFSGTGYGVSVVNHITVIFIILYWMLDTSFNSNHLIYGTPPLYTILYLLFNSMQTHGYFYFILFFYFMSDNPYTQ